jgi:phenylacetate-CoA ligase
MFINDQFKNKPLFKEYTSGSTGTPIKIYHSVSSLRYWYALSEIRWRNWYGLSYKKPWAYLAGRKVISFKRKKPPFWVWNKGLNQLYLSCYHLQCDNIPFYLNAMKEHRVEYLYGLASSINEIAYYGSQLNINPPVLKAVVTCAEVLYPNHKKNIEDYFSCQVYNSYGSTEKVIAASECKFNNMHLWPDAGITEIASPESDDGLHNTSGSLICTGLVNDAMPLIRYKIGDIGSKNNKLCDCGRAMPIMTSIDGRSDDMILSPDGRRIMVIWSFLKNMPIFELQLVQHSLSKIDINYVSQVSLSKRNKNIILTKLKSNLGNFIFSFNRKDKIIKNNNGKFKGVISKI